MAGFPDAVKNAKAKAKKKGKKPAKPIDATGKMDDGKKC